LSPELQLLTRIVPCGSQYNTHGVQEQKLLHKGWKASDKCYTQQKGIVPLQRALIVMLIAVLIPICDLWVVTLVTDKLERQWLQERFALVLKT